MKLIKESIYSLVHRCPKCGGHLSCANDNWMSYGLWLGTKGSHFSGCL